MPSKEDVLKSIVEPQYNTAQVKHLVTSVSMSATAKNLLPIKLKKGDIISITDSLGKDRPAVVIKVTKDSCICLGMSTTPDQLCFHKCNSRFNPKSYLTTNLLVLKLEDALINYVGMYDNTADLNRAIVEFKKILKKWKI